MGQWRITVEGTGAHHNQNYPQDANRLAEDFVHDLIAAGHTVRKATFEQTFFGQVDHFVEPYNG